MLDPFRLPVHPAIVHFPVALLTIVWGMLVLRYVTGHPKWDTRARLFHLIGVASIPVALVAAIIDTRGFEFVTSPRWDAPLIWHALGGLLLAGATVGHFLWRRRYTPEALVGRLAVADIALASVVLWGLIGVSLLAGEMVYAT
jgi:uncharacterized membrane protein